MIGLFQLMFSRSLCVLPCQVSYLKSEDIPECVWNTFCISVHPSMDPNHFYLLVHVKNADLDTGWQLNRKSKKFSQKTKSYWQSDIACISPIPASHHMQPGCLHFLPELWKSPPHLYTINSMFCLNWFKLASVIYSQSAWTNTWTGEKTSTNKDKFKSWQIAFSFYEVINKIKTSVPTKRLKATSAEGNWNTSDLQKP